MRKIALAAVALAAFQNAYAQSNVTLYGILDLGLWYQSKAPGATAGSNAGNLTSLNTGGLSPSVFGIRGEEDLGGDLKLTFNLESHLDPSTGTTGFNALWSRAANVGIAGKWGSVKLGQQLVPALIAYAATDPRGVRESLSGTQTWAFSSLQNIGPGTATPNSTLAFFSSNAISYQYAAGGLYAGALYGFGEKPGDSRANRVLSLGASYTGPVIVSGSYHASQWASTGENSDRKWSVGIGIPVGEGVVKANYLSTRAYASTGLMYGDWRIASVGGECQTSASNRVTAAYYRGRNELAGLAEDKAHSIVLSDEYSLSKRTVLYAQVAAIRARDQAGIVVSVLGGQPVGGATTYVVNTGIRHRF